MNKKNQIKLDTATFGQGCFWCSQSIFEEVKGVKKVIAGYAGGEIPNPSYQQVCSGETGYAEVVQVIFNPKEVDYITLLEIFWRTHNPTTLNRQGADVGTQYRSVIFFNDKIQQKEALSIKNRLETEKIWDKPIVTEITALTSFYPAEEYHQDYYKKNPAAGYCQFVITPKIEKFRKIFKSRLKK